MGEDELGKLFIGAVDKDTTQEEFQTFFAKFGELSDCVLMKEADTPRNRGFGFVKYVDPANADLVLNSPDIVLNGKKLDPKKCTPRGSTKPKSDSSGLQAEADTPHKIFIGGLPQGVTEEEVTKCFNQFGQVSAVKLAREPDDPTRTRGFGFVSFMQARSAQEACQEHYVVCGGKRVECKPAEVRGNRMKTDDKQQNQGAVNNWQGPQGPGGPGSPGGPGPFGWGPGWGGPPMGGWNGPPMGNFGPGFGPYGGGFGGFGGFGGGFGGNYGGGYGPRGYGGGYGPQNGFGGNQGPGGNYGGGQYGSGVGGGFGGNQGGYGGGFGGGYGGGGPNQGGGGGAGGPTGGPGGNTGNFGGPGPMGGGYPLENSRYGPQKGNFNNMGPGGGGGGGMLRSGGYVGEMGNNSGMGSGYSGGSGGGGSGGGNFGPGNSGPGAGGGGHNEMYGSGGPMQGNYGQQRMGNTQQFHPYRR